MDVDKQQNQKAIVAFLAGLLVGGLLVWVFSATGDRGLEQRANSQLGGLSETNEDENEDEDNNSPRIVFDTNASAGAESGTLVVRNQAAGGTVEIAEIGYPETEGWIVVHEQDGEALGKALGAARFHTGVGLLPKEVKLLRDTESGKTYSVAFYSESGDRIFKIGEDRPLTNEDGALLSTTFVAE